MVVSDSCQSSEHGIRATKITSISDIYRSKLDGSILSSPFVRLLTKLGSYLNKGLTIKCVSNSKSRFLVFAEHNTVFRSLACSCSTKLVLECGILE